MNVEIDVPTIRGRCTPLRKTGSNVKGLAIDNESRDLLEKFTRSQGPAMPFKTPTFLSNWCSQLNKIVVNSQ